MQKMGVVWGSQGALKVINNVTIRQSAYDFLFDFNRNHASILYRFQDIAGYLSKVADFDPPHLHSAPSQGMTPVEFRGDLWHQKTSVPGLSCGVFCDPLFSCFSRTPTCVRQTDRQTQTQTQAMASTANAQHRAVKIGCILNSQLFHHMSSKNFR